MSPPLTKQPALITDVLWVSPSGAAQVIALKGGKCRAEFNGASFVGRDLQAAIEWASDTEAAQVEACGSMLF